MSFQADRTIYFYRQGDEFGEFSNFYPSPVIIDDLLWPTTEHYFQAQKFVGTEHVELVRNAKTASIAAKMGRSRQRPLRHDWEEVKDDIMRKALLAKFTQYESLKNLLLSTGSRFLVEHTKNDRYWADGGDGSGRNMLGKLLVELREKLREE
eukprot:TRINITY_DN1696_c0_g1_i1.p1 TRINITY_DN1696_c0_g1~~TRINITY_DN1696_c0_g1_i1.p1  ORF type:complete len:174 (+),score=33.58 TRINITY_DN1696_c0_g1_i1:68-523(+)